MTRKGRYRDIPYRLIVKSFDLGRRDGEMERWRGEAARGIEEAPHDAEDHSSRPSRSSRR